MRQQGLFKTIYKGGSAPMCSIAGMIDLAGSQIPGLAHKLKVMNELQAHRGPDGNGIWMREAENVGLAHCRLSIIDIASGQQPMTDHHGNWVCFNGEIYNYIELKQQLGGTYETTSDTEVISYIIIRERINCSSIEEAVNRAKLNRTASEALRSYGVFDGLPETDQMSFFTMGI